MSSEKGDWIPKVLGGVAIAAALYAVYSLSSDGKKEEVKSNKKSVT